MASTSKSQLGFLLFSLLTLTTTLVSSSVDPLSVSDISTSDDPPPPTVYDILPKFGLPSGLLPDTVTSYSLSDDGSFVVELPKPCYIHFDYLVYYERKITGKLKVGSISDLDGIQVQKLFLWFNVDEIRVDLPPSDSIYFQVGIINRKLDIDQFETVHSCRRKKKSGSCGQSLKGITKLPTLVDEAEMLITE